jgi:hypothetical protein
MDARREDVESIEGIVTALYEVVSGGLLMMVSLSRA